MSVELFWPMLVDHVLDSGTGILFFIDPEFHRTPQYNDNQDYSVLFIFYSILYFPERM